jgi:hypothetical protein
LLTFIPLLLHTRLLLLPEVSNRLDQLTYYYSLGLSVKYTHFPLHTHANRISKLISSNYACEFRSFITFFRGWSSILSTPTMLQAGQPGFESWEGHKIFLFSKTFRLAHCLLTFKLPFLQFSIYPKENLHYFTLLEIRF